MCPYTWKVFPDEVLSTGDISSSMEVICRDVVLSYQERVTWNSLVVGSMWIGDIRIVYGNFPPIFRAEITSLTLPALRCVHPHASRTQVLCLGSHSAQVARWFLFGEYALLADFFYAFLGSYHQDGADTSIINFRKQWFRAYHEQFHVEYPSDRWTEGPLSSTLPSC